MGKNYPFYDDMYAVRENSFVYNNSLSFHIRFNKDKWSVCVVLRKSYIQEYSLNKIAPNSIFCKISLNGVLNQREPPIEYEPFG